MPYYDYDNSSDDDGDDDDDDDSSSSSNKKQNKHQKQSQTQRKSSPMLNTIRERRAANILNENYVTDAQNNGKRFTRCNLIRKFSTQMTCRDKRRRQCEANKLCYRFTPTYDTKQMTNTTKTGNSRAEP